MSVGGLAQPGRNSHSSRPLAMVRSRKITIKERRGYGRRGDTKLRSCMLGKPHTHRNIQKSARLIDGRGRANQRVLKIPMMKAYRPIGLGDTITAVSEFQKHSQSEL